MKFGETLYQRSVPKWAAYNVNYNELKRLIKLRTSSGVALPLTIPGQGISRWEDLEKELFSLLKDQHDNITLFLRSKQGEIERRLTYLERQVRIAQHAVAGNTSDRPVLQARKYQRLVQEAEDIGDDILNLSRFAAVQKTAFRKILKKYRKWTGSTTLQQRLDVEVFSLNPIRVDYADYLERLAIQTTIITDKLAGPIPTGRTRKPAGRPRLSTAAPAPQKASITRLNEAAAHSPLLFDATLSSVPYGEYAGSAFYWIHPDNLDEARALLLRHMRDLRGPATLSRANSATSFTSEGRQSVIATTHTVLFDNAQRFTHDTSTVKPSKIALSARWSEEQDATVTLSALAPSVPDTQVLILRRKEIGPALRRDLSPKSDLRNADEVGKIQSYLAEHRDVKPLVEVCSKRSRYTGITNSADVGTWATLDTSVSMAPVDVDQVGVPGHDIPAGEVFPHAVLHIRWEFIRAPTVVRAFDESHLAERVPGFTLEEAAICTICKDLPPPAWRPILEKDIRKVPVVPRKPRISRNNTLTGTEISSGPSSTDGAAAHSILSAHQGPSSATSEDLMPGVSGIGTAIAPRPGKPKALATGVPRKQKRARIQTPERSLMRQQRYWNEFDDGEEDVNPQESYAIYVNPNEPLFPGAETVSKAFGAMYDGLSKGTSRAISLISNHERSGKSMERTPLLGQDRQQTTDADAESSESDTDELFIRGHPLPPKRKSHPQSQSQGPGRPPVYRPHQPLTPRQKALEKMLFYFYTGLIVLSYVMLAMAGILLDAGRRKAIVQVDAGVIVGVVVAEICAIVSVVLLFSRRQQLSILHWALMGVAIAGVVVVGVAIVSLMWVATQRRRGKHKREDSLTW